MQLEMKKGREEDAEAQSSYEKGRSAAKDMLDALLAKRTSKKEKKADIEKSMNEVKKSKSQSAGDLSAEKDLKKTLLKDCAWVESHFQTRSGKRQEEIDGLQEAKGYLAGVESGEEIAP